jgi:hypothetical protein
MTSTLSKRGRQLPRHRSEDSITHRIIDGCEGMIYVCDRNGIERNGFMFYQQVSYLQYGMLYFRRSFLFFLSTFVCLLSISYTSILTFQSLLLT